MNVIMGAGDEPQDSLRPFDPCEVKRDHLVSRISLLILSLVVLAGCAVGPSATSTPNPGQVTIQRPQTGAIIYGSTLYISGTAENLPTGQFRLSAVTASDEVIIDSPVTIENGVWSYETPNAYTGDPTELTISALPAAGGPELDVASVVISSEANRPEGTFGSILNPFEGETVGSGTIPLNGTASGLFEGTLNIDLKRPDGSVITGIVLTVENPGLIDEVPWQADIQTTDYRGPAVLRAYYHSAQDGTPITLATVPITIGDAAG